MTYTERLTTLTDNDLLNAKMVNKQIMIKYRNDWKRNNEYMSMWLSCCEKIRKRKVAEKLNK